MIAAVVAPVLHEYEPPPLAVKVLDVPAQILLVPVMPVVGLAFTVNVLLAVAVQLLVVTVTV